MPTYNNPKYLSLPQQVQKNKDDIETLKNKPGGSLNDSQYYDKTYIDELEDNTQIAINELDTQVKASNDELIILKERITELEAIIGGTIIGYVDENNVIVLVGELEVETYTVKYEMEDESLIYIGELDLVEKHSVTNNLTDCTNSNASEEIVDGNSYSAIITANEDYVLASVTVIMGGVNITSTAVSGGTINISSVTGDIVITAVAVDNLADPTSADWAVASRFSSGGVVQPTDGLTADITNYIPVENGSVVRVKGMNLTNSLSNGSATRQAFYTLDGTSKVFLAVADTSSTHETYVTNEGNGVQSITISDDFKTALAINYAVKYIRLNGTLTGTKEDVIITVDEEI